jgi:hypothetical protein
MHSSVPVLPKVSPECEVSATAAPPSAKVIAGHAFVRIDLSRVLSPQGVARMVVVRKLQLMRPFMVEVAAYGVFWLQFMVFGTFVS